MLKRFVLPIGVLVLIGAAAWYLIITPQAQQRFDEAWTWNYNIDGQYDEFEEGIDETIYDSLGSEYEYVVATIYEVSVDQDRSSDDELVITEYFAEVEPVTREVIYEYTTDLMVNPETGKFTDEELSDYYYLYPRNVEKNRTCFTTLTTVR